MYRSTAHCNNIIVILIVALFHGKQMYPPAPEANTALDAFCLSHGVHTPTHDCSCAAWNTHKNTVHVHLVMLAGVRSMGSAASRTSSVRARDEDSELLGEEEGWSGDEAEAEEEEEEEEEEESEPYRLCAVGHSLGGMSLLVHAVVAGMEGRRSRVHRLVLLTPAGIHAHIPRVGGAVPQHAARACSDTSKPAGKPV